MRLLLPPPSLSTCKDMVGRAGAGGKVPKYGVKTIPLYGINHGTNHLLLVDGLVASRPVRSTLALEEVGHIRQDNGDNHSTTNTKHDVVLLSS